jgi:choline dehydrogenase-like flavoprotein
MTETLSIPGQPANPTPPGPMSQADRAASLALLEAIIPGSDSIPPADEATLVRTEEVVQSVSPNLVPLFRKAQRALSEAAVLSTGRSFAALDTREQQALLQRWYQTPALRSALAALSLVYKFVHFDRPGVYERLGGRLNVVPEGEEPPWRRQMMLATDLPADETLECDVVVVGTGAGGAVVGRELAERGRAVVFVEEGSYHDRRDFDGSSVRAHLSFYRFAVTFGNTVMPLFMGRLVGGSTAVNGGTCFRTPPWVLDRWCDDLRTDECAPGAMKPWFERVESFLGVAPTEPRFLGPIDDVVSRGCDALGWSYGRIPRNAPGCEGSGFCNFGCRTDARRSTNISYIPAALRRGALCMTELHADRVLTEGGRAVGIEGVARDGRRVKVRASAVILAGGSIPTPLFLMRQGICNKSGQVGRNLSLHPSGGLNALFDEEIRGADFVPQGHAVDQFARDGIMILTALGDHNVEAVTLPMSGKPLMDVLDRRNHLAGVGTLVADASPNGRVWWERAGKPAITYNLQREDLRRLHEANVRAGEMFLAAGAKRLYPLVLTRPIVEPDDFHEFRRQPPSASELVVVSYHPLGTCRMGRDPKTSVVDSDHQTHDLKRLFIVDGSTINGPLGVNPQLTIMAVATRAAARIDELLD